jgi:hypothetical protein
LLNVNDNGNVSGNVSGRFLKVKALWNISPLPSPGNKANLAQALLEARSISEALH